FVCDAISESDFSVVATALPHLELYSGGSVLAAHLARSAQRVAKSFAPAPFARVASTLPLFISGSGSEATREQVRHALEGGFSGIKIDPRLLDDPEQAARETLDELQGRSIRPLVYATAEPQEVDRVHRLLGRMESGQRIEEYF